MNGKISTYNCSIIVSCNFDLILIIFINRKTHDENTSMLLVLKKCFDGFCVDDAIPVDTIGTILSLMALKVKPSALKEIIDEIDEDKSG